MPHPFRRKTRNGWGTEVYSKSENALVLRGFNLDKFVLGTSSGKSIVGPLPLAIYLHSRLRRWMAVAKILRRQRMGALFRQHPHLHRDLFEGGRMCGPINLGACQPIHGLFGRVHRHIELFAVNARCDDYRNGNFSCRTVKNYQCAIGLIVSISSSATTAGVSTPFSLIEVFVSCSKGVLSKRL